MLTENKFSKYLIYAIGEIILVVIGILIAVQINSAFNNSQREKLEMKVLVEIESNLKRDLIEFQTNQEAYEHGEHLCRDLINHFQHSSPYRDSIGGMIYLFQKTPTILLSGSGYSLLETKGIDLIKNDSLRIKITDLYERLYPFYETYSDDRKTMVNNQLQPYLSKHFFLEYYDKMHHRKRVPVDYGFIQNDPLFMSLLQTNYFHNSRMKRRSRDLASEVQNLLIEIQEYVKDESNE